VSTASPCRGCRVLANLSMGIAHQKLLQANPSIDCVCDVYALSPTILGVEASMVEKGFHLHYQH
jgi:hypothetical protein